MSNLVIHFQGHDLIGSGGAGKYASNLLQRVEDRQSPLYSTFEQVFPLNAHSETMGRSRLRMTFGKVGRAFLPPIAYQVLRRAVHSQKAEDVQVLQETTVLHELTAYMTCSQIGRWSLSPKLRLCVTSLDLQDLFYPEYFSDSMLTARRLTYSFYRERADLFFAISEFTKKTMVEQMGIPAEKIKVTYLGASDLSAFPVVPRDSQFAKSLGRYFLYPAKLWRHKNHRFLIRSVSHRRAEFEKKGISLVLTGGFNSHERAELREITREHHVSHLFKVLGFVSQSQLRELYCHAEFLVFPSLFEGFGMPVLEAMTLGCPVLCSSASSLPEVGGEPALYFDPQREEALVELLDQVLGEKVDRELLCKKGLEHSKKFTWDRTFLSTLEGYKLLA